MKRVMWTGLIGLGVLAALAGVAPAADESPNPEGRPKQFKVGKRKAYAVYSEDGVWNLRMTGPEGKRCVFTGTVEVNGDKLTGDFQGLEKAKKTKDADWIALSENARSIEFRFIVLGATDGIRFRPGPKADSVSFRLLVDDDDNPENIFIGTAGTHPDKATFTIPLKK